MNMAEYVKNIYKSDLSDGDKLTKIKDFIIDCQNEMDAQDQNMNPEVKHRLSEAMQIAKQYIYRLENND